MRAPVPAGDPPPAEPRKRAAAKPPPRRRKPIPAALKAIAGLFVLAIVFIVAAILGGGSAHESPETPAPVSRVPSASDSPTASQAPEELGYPAFATANTTRVGGGDPASSAAAVALAAYPSATSAQRPEAVTLADSGDWPAALAAAALTAPPIGAPILLAEDGSLPEPSAQALDALAPQGGKTTAGATIFALGDAPEESGEATRRVAGEGARAAVAVARLREKLTGEAPRHILIASSSSPEFALPAAAWAARSGDPVLFAAAKQLPKPTASYLRQHSKVPVFVLGPSAAISSAVVRAIDAVGGAARRVSGEDPVANAIAFARYAAGSFGWNVNDPGHGFVVARSDQPLNAAAAAPLSASGAWGPLLLTDSADTLPAALRGYLLDVKPGYTTDPTRAFYNHVWVIGDQEAISVNEQAEIDELAALAKIGGEP
jgi:putative cell wall binding repeat protein